MLDVSILRPGVVLGLELEGGLAKFVSVRREPIIYEVDLIVDPSIEAAMALWQSQSLAQRRRQAASQRLWHIGAWVEGPGRRWTVCGFWSVTFMSLVLRVLVV